MQYRLLHYRFVLDSEDEICTVWYNALEQVLQDLLRGDTLKETSDNDISKYFKCQEIHCTSVQQPP